MQETENLINNEATLEFNYSQAVKTRVDLFRATPNSLEKKLRYIRASILAQFDRESTEAQTVISIIAKLRSRKSIKKEKVDIEGNVAIHSISQSQRSYGSMISNFNELLNKLTAMNYQSPTTDYQLPQLQAFAESLVVASDAVDYASSQLRIARKYRDEHLLLFPKYTKRIKNYILVQYGFDSAEYNNIKNL